MESQNNIYWITINYRKAYDIFASNGILFNHESSRRGETFVTKKIVSALFKIKNNKQKKIIFGKYLCKKGLGSCKRLLRSDVENFTI